MSASSVPSPKKQRLWGRAAGRCEYTGCNHPLWIDGVTKKEMNASYIAHIIADEPGGPRGDVVLSPLLRAELSNLMLLCDRHHRLIDVEDVAGHSVERLRAMKAAHERRIEIVGAIGTGQESTIVLYGAKVGPHSAALSYDHAAPALLPSWYPKDAQALNLGMARSTWTDLDAEFWRIEGEHLDRVVATQLRPRLSASEIDHLSIFGIAPQPLLMKFGFLLSDITRAEIYQLHREPPSWEWQPTANFPEFQRIEPTETGGPPAVVFSVSGNVAAERVREVLPDATIWELRVPDPHNDVLQSREQLASFRRATRRLYARVSEMHGVKKTVHVFPALPVAAAIEAGRVVMPKCTPPLRVYNQNSASTGFTLAFDLNSEILK